jgi:TRAP-type C4-dicarboxylate transport system permease small subunit
MLNKITKNIKLACLQLEKVLEVFGAIILFLMVLMIVIGVYYRYILRSPLAWVPELTMYSQAWLSLVGAALAVKKNEHVSITFLYEKFSEKIKYNLNILKIICMGFLAFMMVVGGYNLALNAKLTLSSFVNISMSIPMASIPVSGFLILIFLVDKWVKLKGKNEWN